jgi:hypothetical protein
MSNNLEEITKVAEELNRLLIEGINLLREYKPILVLECKVDIPMNRCLVYGKRNNRWDLFIRDGKYEYNIADLGIADKVDAIRAIPLLYEELKEERKVTPYCVQSAIEEFKEFLFSIEE